MSLTTRSSLNSRVTQRYSVKLPGSGCSKRAIIAGSGATFADILSSTQRSYCYIFALTRSISTMMAVIRSRYGSPSDLTTRPQVSVVQRMQPQPHINMHSASWLLISSEAGHGRYTFKSARGNFRHCVGRQKSMTKRLHDA